ncbi:MAG TPA: hypothetical protein VL463_14435 [Kofleriaceae bacterium]|jgi:hypothetical protein|nr:hypothetical protein [Kofleriaceae bacterium]
MKRAIVIALLLIGGTARAQSAKAAAQAAFEKAKQLMGAGSIEEACAAFDESERLDPQLGTQYNLALCYEKQGKLTSAWINFSEVAAKDTKGGRRDDSAKRAKALEPRLSRVVITIVAVVPGERVHLGTLDVHALAGSAQPIDEGSYDVVAGAIGYVEWRGHVDVKGEGTTVAVEVPALEKVDVIEAPPPPPPASGHGRRVGGVALAGAGVVAIGVGLYFGKQVMDLQSDAETACMGPVDPCAGDVDQARTLTDDAKDKALIADLAVGGGAALVIAGVILYATAPHETQVAPVIGPDRVGLSFATHW